MALARELLVLQDHSSNINTNFFLHPPNHRRCQIVDTHPFNHVGFHAILLYVKLVGMSGCNDAPAGDAAAFFLATPWDRGSPSRRGVLGPCVGQVHAFVACFVACLLALPESST